jgi:flagellar biosynthesis/type III secretory pathway M-ring protein FliF/YscJ
MAQTLALARIGALAIGPLLAILALAFLLLRRRPSAAARAGTPEVLPPPAAPFLPPLSDPAQLPLTVDERRLYVREQLGQLAQRHPAAVAAALQSWIEEEGEGRS